MRIEDYALIGDCHSAALVGRDGSIDWLCWPRFDSAACFAALLGEPKHGRWKIAPAGVIAKVERRYRPDTLVLENRVVFGTVNANLRHYHAAADALSHANRAWLDRLITRRVGLKDWDQAYEKREGDVKTVLLFED